LLTLSSCKEYNLPEKVSQNSGRIVGDAESIHKTGLWEMTVQTKTVSQQGFTPFNENAKERILESGQML
jgi:hypothetical protein